MNFLNGEPQEFQDMKPTDPWVNCLDTKAGKAKFADHMIDIIDLKSEDDMKNKTSEMICKPFVDMIGGDFKFIHASKGFSKREIVFSIGLQKRQSQYRGLSQRINT